MAATEVTAKIRSNPEGLLFGVCTTAPLSLPSGCKYTLKKPITQ